MKAATLIVHSPVYCTAICDVPGLGLLTVPLSPPFVSAPKKPVFSGELRNSYSLWFCLCAFFCSRSLELLWPFWMCVQKETRRRHSAKNVTGFFLLGFEYLFIALPYFHCYANKVLFDIQRPLTKLCFWYAYIILCAVCHFSQLTHNTIFYLKNQSARCICFMLH